MARPLGRWLVGACVVALALLPVPAQAQVAPPPPTGIGIRLTEAPSDRAADPRALAYIVDHVEPGTTIHRQIEVSNGTGERAELALYPTGAGIDGGAFRAAEGRTTNEVAGWISVEPRVVVLEPGGRAVATVTIAVPSGAESGERYGAVLAEHAPSVAGDGAVALVTRVGVRVYLSVGGDEPASDFVITSVTGSEDADGRHLAAAVTNTGGRALDLTGEASLTDGPGGASAGPLPTTGATTVAPGDRATVRIPVDPALAEGPWTAAVTLRSGTVERSGTGPAVFFGVIPTGPATEPPPPAPAPAPVEEAVSTDVVASTAPSALDRLRALAEALLTGLAFPLLLLVAIGVFLVLQDRLDRRDTKIGLAPMDADPLLNFE